MFMTANIPRSGAPPKVSSSQPRTFKGGPHAPAHHPKLNNAAFPPVATVFHVTARSTANLNR